MVATLKNESDKLHLVFKTTVDTREDASNSRYIERQPINHGNVNIFFPSLLMDNNYP
jgi:hypothetical protein